MKIFLLCLLGLSLVGCAVFFRIVWACAVYHEMASNWRVLGPKSCPEILPRKTGYRWGTFVSGFTLGVLATIAGAWALLEITR